MELNEKNRIYDRLSEISFKIDIKSLPDFQYINEKIGQCHILIEEVEKFFISVSREMYVIQRSLNDHMAAYENARDTLIATEEDIRNLPSQKDREGRANVSLKKELNEIKKLKNELNDLEGIQKVINLKLKNLTRLNSDIKIQLKLMESQIRLGTPSGDNSAVKSLMEELGKSTMGLDIFNESETKSEDTNVVDPTEPLNINELLINSIPPVEENPIDRLFGPKTDPFKEMKTPDQIVPLSEKIDLDNLLGGSEELNPINDPTIQADTEEEKTAFERLLDPLPTDPEDSIDSCMPDSLVEDLDQKNIVVDLDRILITEPDKSLVEQTIEPKEIIGGKQEENKTKTPVESNQKETQKNKNQGEIDLDSLLSQFN